MGYKKNSSLTEQETYNKGCNTKSGKKDKRKENEEFVIIIGVLRSGFI